MKKDTAFSLSLSKQLSSIERDASAWLLALTFSYGTSNGTKFSGL